MKTPMQSLHDQVADMVDMNLKSACRALLSDPQFPVWPAAIGMHHAYPGGLAAHTEEVLRYANEASGAFGPRVNTDILTAACLWHDYAKVFEYELVSVSPSADPPEKSLRYQIKDGMVEYWVRSDYLYKIGHISGSAMMFYNAAFMRDVRTDLTDAVLHCILSHHGPVKEWGSPVAPQSIEAILLHSADLLSAKHGATKGQHP